MDMISLPDFVFHRLVEFVDVNALIDCCWHLIRLKSDLYCISLDQHQCLAYYRAHCKESYIRCRMDKKYYASTYDCSKVGKYVPRRVQPPLQITLDEDQLAYYRTIRRVKVTLFESSSEYCVHVIIKHIGAFIVELRTDMDVAPFSSLLPNLETLRMEGITTLDIRTMPSVQHVILSHCRLSLLCGHLRSVTLIRSHISIVECISVATLSLQLTRYRDVFPDKSLIAYFKRIYYFTETLTLRDMLQFHDTTYIVILRHGISDKCKVIKYDP
jgi:hypothetical protein